jgi:hypothetical protein
MLLSNDLAIELVLGHLLFGEALIAPRLEAGEADLDALRLSAIRATRCCATGFPGNAGRG